jgi:hypothetical protein
MIGLSRAAFMSVSMALAAATGDVFSIGLSEGRVELVMLFTTLVGGVVAAVAWIDRRIKDQIVAHAKDDAHRHSVILRELAQIREWLKFNHPRKD